MEYLSSISRILVQPILLEANAPLQTLRTGTYISDRISNVTLLMIAANLKGMDHAESMGGC